MEIIVLSGKVNDLIEKAVIAGDLTSIESKRNFISNHETIV